MRRLQLMTVLLFALLVLDETIGAYHKSSKESKDRKKQKKPEREVYQAKKYSGASVKQHKRQTREAPVQINGDTEKSEVEELQESGKELQKEKTQREKYNKKEKTKQANEESYVSKSKRKLKEQENQAYDKTKADIRKQKPKVVEEDIEAKTIESNKANCEDEESVTCSQKNLAENRELDMVTAPKQKSSCTNKYTEEEEILEEQPTRQKNEDKNYENVPAKKCYYK